ncbi:nucleotide sugar dehydrogenase [Jeotgalibaca arthritidis]|uniref:Nucleotide sugar dehydrogenase n=1 Tax=Jeotgalibaca arthritidis TaxID=1868794 RepID=A0A6G7KB59_9LACT|nr:nucleotide sugar dehydrogenase [Jeotgalibaca arthritidis]QII82441.1 nucleotide sugar dehydrogenase [Jeotgalibaca arthritidis]
MELYDSLISKEKKLALVGLGYVGMPIAVAFAEKVNVIGFDTNKEKIALYKKGIDPTNEVGNEVIKNTSVDFTYDENRLKEANFIVIAVPTPINQDKTPDLSPVEGATRTVGRNLKKGSVVVYESTVYPGVTEDVCIPILEEESGLKCGVDFKVGYSPERINPGDKVHRLENIIKIVSGIDEESLELIAKVYELVIEVGVHRAKSIKVAEAAKVVENSQRDINIAFMNELAMAFDRMGINTMEVVEAMNTKWNSLGFTPGLVGGHCIGVDPYYFVYEAEKLGYHSQIVLSGRQINDGMGNFITDSIIKKLVLSGKKVRDARVGIFGLTFKENTPDIRNTKVTDIISGLNSYGIEPIVTDPIADISETKREYNIDLISQSDIRDLDCVVLAVTHDDYKEMSFSDFEKFYSNTDEKVFIDIKSMFEENEIVSKGYHYWSL